MIFPCRSPALKKGSSATQAWVEDENWTSECTIEDRQSNPVHTGLSPGSEFGVTKSGRSVSIDGSSGPSRSGSGGLRSPTVLSRLEDMDEEELAAELDRPVQLEGGTSGGSISMPPFIP
jgi:hypothetical protein